MATDIGLTSVPEWDGPLISFRDFEEGCYWYVRGLRKSDRPLAVPRLIRRLPRSAKQLVRQMNRHRLASRSGLSYLLQMIKSKLLIPQVQDVGRYISAYFEKMQCRKGESIQEYVTRERLIYLDMCRAIRALEPPKTTPAKTSTRAPSNTSQEDEQTEHWEQEDFDEIWPNSRAEEDEQQERGRTREWGKGQHRGGSVKSNKSDWSVISDESNFELDESEIEQTLPDQIQGYFLLMRADNGKVEISRFAGLRLLSKRITALPLDNTSTLQTSNPLLSHLNDGN